MQGNRANDEIERLCVKKAKENWTKLGSTFSKIESKNLNETLLIEEFQKLKENQVSSGEEYNRFMDVYLDLVHVKFESEDGLWEHLSNFHPDIIGRAYWCINPFIRTDGYWVISDMLNVVNLMEKSQKEILKFRIGNRENFNWKIALFGLTNYLFSLLIIITVVFQANSYC